MVNGLRIGALALRVLLNERDCKLGVVVADGLGLAPDRLPGFVVFGDFGVCDPETVLEVGLVVELGGAGSPGEDEAELRRLDHRLAFVGERPLGLAFICKGKLDFGVSVGRIRRNMATARSIDLTGSQCTYYQQNNDRE